MADEIATLIRDFAQSYIIPYLPILLIALLTVWFAFWISGRRTRYLLKAALRAEMVANSEVTKAIIAYADAQLSGQTSVSPMPRYHMGAFAAYKKWGLMRRLPSKVAEEIERLYMNMESVNKAGRRQEDLAFGPAAAFPNSHTLRLENLTFARDTAHNLIEPYQERLKALR